MTDPIVKDESVIEIPAGEVPATPVPVSPEPGSKTDSALLLKSLQKEREEKRALEVRLQELEAKVPPEVYSDEGKLLQEEIRQLRTTISEITAGNQMEVLSMKYPALKDKSTEFEEFRTKPENVGLPLATAAKAFVVENDLMEVTPRRGLERGGGTRQAPQTGMTADEITTLRTTNFRKYSQMLKDGQIKI